MEKQYKTVTVFCSATDDTSAIYREFMRELGETLAERGLTLVFGGGDQGLMGTVLNAVLNKGGDVRGIITHKLLGLECHNPDVYKEGQLILVDTMIERKKLLMEMGDIILVGPGGWGTIDEFSEYAVSVQIGDVERKPMVFLNFNDFWRAQKEQVLNMLQEGTLEQDKVDFIEFADTIDEVFEDIEKVQTRLDARAREESAQQGER